MLRSQGIVILLHVITKTSRIMRGFETALTKSGYTVRNIDYPSVAYSIETLAEIAAKKIEQDRQSNQPMHFVAHSMGGILVRLIIAKHRPPNLGRVVMIGTPNHGSIVADFMQRFKFFKKLFGPAGQQIVTNSNGIHHRLPSADYECGIIAGDRSIDPWFSWFLFRGRKNDGKVSVENTKLEGMKDFVVVPVPHVRQPKNKKVIQLALNFLASGHF